MLNHISHEQLKQTIKSDPSIIGLDNVLSIAEEVECRGEDGNISCVPDLIFLLKNGNGVLVEIKSSGHHSALKTLDGQLRTGQKYFKDHRRKMYKCIGVYQDKKGNIKTLYI